MDVTTRPTSPLTLASRHSSWETQINEQYFSIARGNHSSRKPRRRYNVPGIPEIDDFYKQYEQRRQRRKAAAAADRASTTDRHMSRADADVPPGSPGHIFQMQDVGEELPESTFSVKSTPARQRHQGSTSYRNLDAMSQRYGLYSSSPRFRFALSYKTGCKSPVLKAASSTESFRNATTKAKTQFYEKQHYKAPDVSSLPSAEHFHALPQPLQPPPVYNPTSDTCDASAYETWRVACEAKLSIKEELEAIPAPPLPSCVSCRDDDISQGRRTNVACQHSMKELYRSSVKNNNGARQIDQTAYFKILKNERHIWHPDRFSKCKAEFRPEILKVANLLFVCAGELYDIESKRLTAMGVDLQTIGSIKTKPTTATTAASATTVPTQSGPDLTAAPLPTDT